ncbi:Uncharacterised protein [Pasteurella multocida]|nr:Uncharacterised protein [Pasteurella multocida]
MSKSCGGACGGDATSAADIDIQASSEALGRWVSVYAVPKMDCPSEERMIRLALNGFEEIRALSFDLSNRRLKVVHDGEVEPVTSKLKTLGLGASLQETVAANSETIKAAEFSAASAKQESGTLRWLLGINALLFVVGNDCRSDRPVHWPDWRIPGQFFRCGGVRACPLCGWT